MAGSLPVKFIIFFLCISKMLFAFEEVDYIGEISYPKSKDYDFIAVDAVGRIFLGGRGRKVLEIFNKFGSHIDSVILESKSAFTKGGGIVLSKKGNIIGIDPGLNVLTKYNPEGKVIFEIGKKGSSGGNFRSPQALFVDSKGNIYVADTGNRRIQTFNEDGIYIGGVLSGDKTGGSTRAIRLTQHEIFTGKVIPKQPLLKSPISIEVDDEGYVYVLDILTRFVIIYNEKGQYMGNINLKSVRGIKDIQPRALAIKDRAIFILDKKYHNIKVFNRAGSLLQEIGLKGTGRGQFYKPKGMDVEGNRLYILDSGNNRIQIFRYGKQRSSKTLQRLRPEQKPKLAIFDVTDNNKESKDRMFASSVSEMLITAFFNSSNFEIVERKEISRVIEELNFDMSGMVSKDSAKEIGKILGVDLGVVGSVSMIGGKIDIDVRLLDMKTGVIMMAVNKKVEDEAMLRESVADMAINLERSYLNRLGAPSPPVGVFAMAAAKSIYIKWDSNPEEDVLGYNIYMKDSKISGFKKIAYIVKTEFKVLDLQVNTSYLFKITAIDSEGKESIPSETITTNTKRLPDFGYALKVKTNELPKEIRFTWSYNEKEDVQNYQIFRCDSIDGDFQLVGTTDKKLFSDAGLLDGTEYFYRIRKVYPNGLTSNFSNTFKCKTDARPQSVIDLSAVPDLPRHIIIKWQPNPLDTDISKYEIFRSEVSDGTFESIKTVSSFRKSYKDIQLSDNTTYYYKIKAIDKYKLESDLSEQVFATTKDIPQVPFNVAAESNLARKIRITWDYDMDRMSKILFTVYRSDSIEGVFDDIAKVRDKKYIDEKLPDLKQYFYFVSATDMDKLVSHPSEIVEATTKQLPSIPQNFKAIDRQARKVTLLWNKNPEPDIDHYKIYASKRFESGYHVVAESKETNFVYDNKGKGLKDDTPYYFKITANDIDKLESIYTEALQSTTKALPSSPENIVIVEYNGDGIVLSWPPVAGEDIFGYVVYKNNSKIEVVKTNLYKDKNITPGKRYVYQIATLDIDQLVSAKSDKVKYHPPKI